MRACVAVCCSVLQCVDVSCAPTQGATHCNKLQDRANTVRLCCSVLLHYNKLQHTATHCTYVAWVLAVGRIWMRCIAGRWSVLQCTAGWHSVLHCEAVCYSVLPRAESITHTATHWLQRSATHCKTLQHTATHYNTLQGRACGQCARFYQRERHNACVLQCVAVCFSVLQCYHGIGAQAPPTW